MRGEFLERNLTAAMPCGGARARSFDLCNHTGEWKLRILCYCSFNHNWTQEGVCVCVFDFLFVLIKYEF